MPQSMSEFDEKKFQLIHYVKKYPCLYNVQNPEYFRTEITKDVWKTIAEKLDWRKHECKRNWRSLRRKYMNKEITCEKMVRKLRFLDDLANHHDDKHKLEETVAATNNNHSDSKLKSNEDCKHSTPPKELPQNQHENNTSSSIFFEDDSDIEEIKPTIDCIEIDSSSSHLSLSDTAEESEKNNNFTIEIALNELWQNKEGSLDIEEFSTFLKDVLETCRDFPPTLLHEIKCKIHDIVENAKLRINENKES